MATPLACHEGMETILNSYFDNTLDYDIVFYYILHTDNITPSVLSTSTTHTDLYSSYYGGIELRYDTQTESFVSTSPSNVVQYGVLPQVTFTFTSDVVNPITSIGIYGMSVDTGWNPSDTRLYFIEPLTPFTPLTGDVFKYTLTLKLGNATALT